MKKIIFAAATLSFAAGPALAAGSHQDGQGHPQERAHGHGQQTTAVGMPGNSADVGRRVEVVMTETDDGAMIFGPASISVARGETVRFVIKNIGELAHEFVLNDHHGIMRHKKQMEEADNVHPHDAANVIRLDPGETGEIIWAFTNNGEFMFACFIPGHFEAGMKGTVTVASS